MRTQTELQEKIDYLTWFKHDLNYQFKITPLSAQRHAVAAAFYRTIDNEIAMVRWCLGQLENTWEDDLSSFIDLFSPLDQAPLTEYPHLPCKRSSAEYWGYDPQPVCAYFSGPDSPKDDQNFDFTRAADPATWTKQLTTERPKVRFFEPIESWPCPWPPRSLAVGD